MWCHGTNNEITLLIVSLKSSHNKLTSDTDTVANSYIQLIELIKCLNMLPNYIISSSIILYTQRKEIQISNLAYIVSS